MEPDFAFQYISILSELLITLLGFIIIFWVFWYENIGKELRLNLGKRMKGFKLLYYYMKFEKKFFRKFIHSKIFFSRKTYGDILVITKLGWLYLFVREKTQNKTFKYTRKIINYNILLSFYFFLALVGIGIQIIMDNISFLNAFTRFSKEQISIDTSLPNIIDKVTQNFLIFLLAFFVYLVIIMFYSLSYYKIKREGIKKEQLITQIIKK